MGEDYNDGPDGFWESQLATKLISEGIVSLASDGKHLQVAANLNPVGQRKAEWLQVAVMNLLYRDVVYKPQYPFGSDLGGGWYSHIY